MCYVRAPPHALPISPAGGGLNNGCPCISHTSLCLSQPWEGGRVGVAVEDGGVSRVEAENSLHSRLCQAATCSARWLGERQQLSAATSSTNTSRHEPPPNYPPLFPHLAHSRMTSCCITNGPKSQRLLSCSLCERQSGGKNDNNDDTETQLLPVRAEIPRLVQINE